MKYIALLLGLLILAPHVSLADASENERINSLRKEARETATLTQTIEGYILHQLVEKEDFSEAPNARKYALCDLDGDKKEDMIVAIDLHPNTGADKEFYYELLCILSSAPSRVIRLRVGRYDEREPVKLIVGHRRIFIEYDVWDSTDPVCCPSLKSTEMLVYQDGKLVILPRYGRGQSNQSRVPTPTSATAPVGQEPRQP